MRPPLSERRNEFGVRRVGCGKQVARDILNAIRRAQMRFFCFFSRSVDRARILISYQDYNFEMGF